jgi:release factor glutamine methyltransferase
MSGCAPVLDKAAERLRRAGVPTPRVDAELLLAHVLDIPRARLLLAPAPADADAVRYAGLVARRAAREPLQHITGTAPFRHLDLAVGPGVFVPRPETELLVDAVLADRPGLVVDLCAGSGALALAIVHEAPESTVYALERDPDALRWLRRNASGTSVTVVDGDVTDAGVLATLHGRADAVVSNPPYVPSATTVEPEVRADPSAAVFAGPDGLDVIPAVIARAADLLRPGGLVAIEHDDSHGTAVPGLLRGDARWDDIADHPDLSGRARFATARRCGPHS